MTNSLPTTALSSGGVLIWTVAQGWGTEIVNTNLAAAWGLFYLLSLFMQTMAQIQQYTFMKSTLWYRTSYLQHTFDSDINRLFFLCAMWAGNPTGVLSVVVVGSHRVQ